jgi:hypothetical protein
MLARLLKVNIRLQLREMMKKLKVRAVIRRVFFFRGMRLLTVIRFRWSSLIAAW